MIYSIKFELEDITYYLINERSFNNKEFENLVKLIRFDLSHHVNSQDLLTILIKEYGFKEVDLISI